MYNKHKKQTLNAQQIKCILIDYLIKKRKSDAILATEVPFLSGKRWADLLQIHKGDLCAFEIKSSIDTLRRLEDQTKDYLNTFDFVSLVVSQGHLDKAQKIISASVGIFVVNEETSEVKLLRAPKRRRKHIKNNLLDFLWREDLLRALRSQKIVGLRQIETTELRTRVKKVLPLAEIHDMAVTALSTRYKPRYKTFLKEKGRETLVEDVSLLTMNLSMPLF